MHQIGFMQGRLCDPVDGKIQAFPWDDWENEFPVAESLGIHLMEWTLDQERLYQNPLLTADGRSRIRHLSQRFQLSVGSLTGDCFMQAPFWKAKGAVKERLEADFHAICRACSALGITIIVVPLVDNGRLDNAAQEDELVEFLLGQHDLLEHLGLQVVFESDYTPAEVRRFIHRLPAARFGINYDIGNSSALGFDPEEEFAAYGSRVINVHIKDRELGGTTVPLTTGAATFEVVFAQLAKVNYNGNFILQTARAGDQNHAGALRTYYQMAQAWDQSVLARIMNLGLAGKAALITGSSKGIGHAIAAALHAEGCRVVLNGRNAGDLAVATSSLDGAAGVVGDVSQALSAHEVVKEAIRIFGGLDILVCNVGSGRSVPPGNETPEEWQRVFAQNLWSATNTVEAAKEALVETKGAIVCISSICGLEVVPGAPVTYSAAKAALHAYVRGIARPLGRSGVRINAIAPGNILFDGSVWQRKLADDARSVDDMLEREISLGSLGSPDDVAGLVTYLASPRSQFATGQVWPLDGGQTRS